MFTGIVQAVGRIAHGERAWRMALRIARRRAARSTLPDVAIGDSVAVSGCCLTVVGDATGRRSPFDVSAETLRCTHGPRSAPATSTWKRRCGLSDRLGGHLMSGPRRRRGHVVTRCRRRAATPTAAGGSAIDAPAELARFIAAKGSIAVRRREPDGERRATAARFSRQPDPAYTRCDDARDAGARRARSIWKWTSIARYVARLQRLSNDRRT